MTQKSLDQLIDGDLDGSNTPDEAQGLARAIEQDPAILERLEDQRRARRDRTSGTTAGPSAGPVRSMVSAALRALRLKA